MPTKKFSISIDEKTYAEASKAVESSEEFRSLSHFFEMAAMKLLKERELARQADNPAVRH
jgi:hypothetical protein